MQLLANLLDAILLRTAGLLPGLSGGGAFYRPKQSLTHFARWTEPGAYTVQLGRIEVILDRK